MKITKSQKKLLAKALAHPILVSNGEFTHSNGEAAHARTVKSLISKKLLIPCGDALFEGFTQSYRVAS